MKLRKNLFFYLFIIILTYSGYIIPNGFSDSKSPDHLTIKGGVQLPYLNETVQEGETVFFNGTVLTMDDTHPTAEAVLVRDGLIVAVGSDKLISELSTSEAKKIDLKGKTLLPGFIDSHSHWLNNHDQFGTIEDSIDLAIRQGWTTISNMFTEPDLIKELQQLDEQGKIRNRINLYLRLSWKYQRWTDWYKEYSPGKMLSPKIRVAGLKIFADGDIASGTIAMNEPWVAGVDEKGSLYFSQSELEQLIKTVDEEGYQIAIHALGDRAVDQVLNVYKSILGNETNNPLRHRIEHLLFLRDDQINQVSRMGIVASFQFHWASSDWYEYYRGYFGSERMKMLSRWRDILDSGAVCVANTDCPYCFLYNTAIHGIYVSTTRIGPEWHSPVPDDLAAQRITVEEALRLITIDAAYATFQEQMTGSITPGKYADIVVLTLNPLKVNPEDLLKIRVWMTMIGGKIEYCEETSETYTLSIKTVGDGSTIPPPGEYYLPGGYLIKVHPLIMYWANVSCRFSHWVLNGEKISDTPNAILMKKNQNLTAVFFNPKEAKLDTNALSDVQASILESDEDTILTRDYEWLWFQVSYATVGIVILTLIFLVWMKNRRTYAYAT